MHALIPAAGYATRLFPLTLEQPKHLLVVKGKPILEWVVGKIAQLDVEEISLVSNEKYYPQFHAWAQKFRSRVPVHVYNDCTQSNEDRLGQIGDIQFGIEQADIDDDLLIVAGDNLFDFSLTGITRFFNEKKCVVNGVRVLPTLEEARLFGVVSLDAENRITAFAEKPEYPASTRCSTGIYLVPQKQLSLFHEYLAVGNNPDKMGYFMEWLIKKFSAYGFPYSGQWYDIGSPAGLEQARKEFNG